MHYHFTVFDDVTYEDPEGEDLPNDDAAMLAAKRIIQELRRCEGGRWDQFTIRVTEGNREVCSFSFAELTEH